MKQKILICFFLFAFLLSGCRKPIESNPQAILETDSEFQIEFKLDPFVGKAKIFYDSEKNFHLVHCDEASPLFGMEEVYSEGKTAFYFGGLYREEATRFEGTALAYFAFDLIEKTAPEKSEGGKWGDTEAKIYTFSENDKRAKLYLSKKDQSPLAIMGEGSLSGLEIRFINQEQN